jgi:hypothetical protein
MSRPVPDKVWQQLDPRAGALSRRTAARMWTAFAVVAVVLAAGTLFWRNGIVVPRLVWPGGSRGWEETNSVLRIQFELANAGWFPVTVQAVGRSGPGLELLGVEPGEHEYAGRTADPPFPVTLRPGQSRTATLVYRITECADVPRGLWPVVAHVQRSVMSMSVDVIDEAGDPWQERVTDWSCKRQRSR